MRGSFVARVLASFVYVLTALALGLLISTVSKTKQKRSCSLILVLLPAVMLSGFVSPIESMPKIFQWMTVVNPIRYFLEIVRGVFLKGIGVSQLWPRYLVLPFMAAVIMTTRDETVPSRDRVTNGGLRSKASESFEFRELVMTEMPSSKRL